jgi:hypothetical protein
LKNRVPVRALTGRWKDSKGETKQMQVNMSHIRHKNASLAIRADRSTVLLRN